MNIHATLRQQLLQRRHAIPIQQRKHAQTAVIQHLHQLIQKYECQKIGVYLAIGSELSIASMFTQLWAQEKQLYVPIIDVPQQGHMCFAPLYAQHQLVKGKFGVPRPHTTNEHIQGQALDICCVPMLGFCGLYRIGWGKGYYDRCFAQRIHQKTAPILVGLAFAHQYDKRIQPQYWDVPVDYLLTEDTIHLS